MNSFKGCRVAHEYVQTNPAAPEKVFPLLCPVREADWIPGWKYELIYSDSGVAEAGCIFTTQDPAVESEKYSRRTDESDHSSPVTTWICTEYDPAAFRIAYVWIKPGLVATELWIRLSPTEAQLFLAFDFDIPGSRLKGIGWWRVTIGSGLRQRCAGGKRRLIIT